MLYLAEFNLQPHQRQFYIFQLKLQFYQQDLHVMKLIMIVSSAWIEQGQ